MSERSFEQVIELSQKTVPVVILDIPHLWTSWVRHTLAAVDEVVIVAEPDLANLRNAKAIADAVKAMRPGESDPIIVVNKTGVSKRPEIPAAEFASSIECRLAAQIGFEPALFGTAANNGQMVAEVSATHKVNDIFRSLGLELTGRSSAEAGSRPSGIRIPDLFRMRKRA